MKSKYKETWHLLHFIITVLFPFWIVVWVARAAINNAHNRRVEHKELMQALMLRSERREDN